MYLSNIWHPPPNLGEILHSHPIWFLLVHCFVLGAHTQRCSRLPPSQHFGVAPGSRYGDGDGTRDTCMQKLCSTFWFNSWVLGGSALQSRPCLDHLSWLILIPFLSSSPTPKAPQKFYTPWIFQRKQSSEVVTLVHSQISLYKSLLGMSVLILYSKPDPDASSSLSISPTSQTGRNYFLWGRVNVHLLNGPASGPHLFPDPPFLLSRCELSENADHFIAVSSLLFLSHCWVHSVPSHTISSLSTELVVNEIAWISERNTEGNGGQSNR